MRLPVRARTIPRTCLPPTRLHRSLLSGKLIIPQRQPSSRFSQLSRSHRLSATGYGSFSLASSSTCQAAFDRVWQTATNRQRPLIDHRLGHPRIVHFYPIMGKGANSTAEPVYEDTAKRVHNFSAGPACLPESVMRTAAADFCSAGGSGIGMMEMSHRDPGGPVQNSMSQAAADLRSLLSVPDSYHVLFMQGGAHGQVGGR